MCLANTGNWCASVQLMLLSLEACYLIKESNSLPSSKHLTFIGNSLNLFIVEFANFCRVA